MEKGAGRGQPQCTRMCLIPGILSPAPGPFLLFLPFWLLTPGFPQMLAFAWFWFDICSGFASLIACTAIWLSLWVSLLFKAEFPKGFPQKPVQRVLWKLGVFTLFIKNRNSTHIPIPNPMPVYRFMPNKYLLHEYRAKFRKLKLK